MVIKAVPATNESRSAVKEREARFTQRNTLATHADNALLCGGLAAGVSRRKSDTGVGWLPLP